MFLIFKDEIEGEVENLVVLNYLGRENNKSRHLRTLPHQAHIPSYSLILQYIVSYL